MIRLVASDLDGTLLQNGALEPSETMIGLIREMKDLGIQFVAASGRQYPNLKRIFSPVWRDIIFVAENGGAVLQHDRILSKSVIDPVLAADLIGELYASERCDVVVSGVSSIYIQPKPASRAYVDYMLYEAHNTVTVAQDITCITDEIIKISALVYDGGSSGFYEQTPQKWKDIFQVAVSGSEWVDFTLTSKGEAIEALRKRLGIPIEETVAFGDNYNDQTMFRSVQYSYAMHSASDEIRRMARHSCNTVESVLENLIAYYKAKA